MILIQSEDFANRRKVKLAFDGCGILNHAAQVYTRTIFYKFQDEFSNIVSWKRLILKYMVADILLLCKKMVIIAIILWCRRTWSYHSLQLSYVWDFRLVLLPCVACNAFRLPIIFYSTSIHLENVDKRSKTKS